MCLIGWCVPPYDVRVVLGAHHEYYGSHDRIEYSLEPHLPIVKQDNTLHRPYEHEDGKDNKDVRCVVPVSCSGVCELCI